ncbi:unnamed protein product, partial [Staurois parvus]
AEQSIGRGLIVYTCVHGGDWNMNHMIWRGLEPESHDMEGIGTPESDDWEGIGTPESHDWEGIGTPESHDMEGIGTPESHDLGGDWST